MEEDITVFHVVRFLLLWLSPFIFIEGLLLLLIKPDKQAKIENVLEKEIGGIKKRIFPKIETNIYTFQGWMLKKSSALGVFFMVFSACMFFILIRY